MKMGLSGPLLVLGVAGQYCSPLSFAIAQVGVAVQLRSDRVAHARSEGLQAWTEDYELMLVTKTTRVSCPHCCC